MSLFIRSAITVVLFSSFILLWIWAWKRENADRFAAAANLPLLDDSDTDRSHPTSTPTP